MLLRRGRWRKLSPLASQLSAFVITASFDELSAVVYRALNKTGRKERNSETGKVNFKKDCVCFHLNVEEIIFSSNWLVSQVSLLTNLLL